MKEIILIGGGGHCKSCIDVIEQENKYKIAGIIDKKEVLGKEVLGYKVIACDEDLPELFKKYQYALITIGQLHNSSIRKKIYETLKDIGFILPTIVSPKAYISKHSNVKEATIVMHDVVINSNSYIGKNCIINTKSLIEHDVTIKDNCHISTASVVNGHCIINENSFIGSNSTVVNNIEIEKNSFIKAGSLVK